MSTFRRGFDTADNGSEADAGDPFRGEIGVLLKLSGGKSGEGIKVSVFVIRDVIMEGGISLGRKGSGGEFVFVSVPSSMFDTAALSSGFN